MLLFYHLTRACIAESIFMLVEGHHEKEYQTVEFADVELVKKIVRDELPSALRDVLAHEVREIEARVTASVVQFQKGIEQRVEQRHSENRVRENMTYELAQKAAEQSTTAVAQNVLILKQQTTHQDEVKSLRDALYALSQDVRTALGRRQAEDEGRESDEKRVEKIQSWFRWVVGLGGAGSLAWVAKHFKWK